MIVAVRLDESTVAYAWRSFASRLDAAEKGPVLVFGDEPSRTDALVERVPIGALLPSVYVEARESFAAMREDARDRALVVILLLLLVLAAGGASLAMIVRAARRERDASAAKGEFVTRVGHDLRTPLALIRMYAETIAQGRASKGEETREFAGIVARESERLTRLVATVLDFGRLHESEIARRRSRKSVDANALLDDIATAHRPLLERAGIRLAVLPSQEKLTIEVDEDALRGALGNLIENTLVHAGAGGALDLSVARDGDAVILSAEDRGPGLPQDSLERVFERFVRGANAQGKGAGLGLALVREVALAHGGAASAKNREGGGLCVTISLPSKTASPPPHVNGSAKR
jgi:two-component system phosphate regulon sensor histidine kinase PhoR